MPETDPRDMSTRRITSALLVDDDTAFRVALQGALRRRAVRAITAATAEEGLTLAEDEPIDLILVDYRMGGTDGLKAISRFRRTCPEAAIVMLTGFGDIPLTVSAMREGADHLLTKPVDVDRLLKEVSSIPRGSDRPRPGVSPSSFRLDEVERETISRALDNAGGVVASAARLLGIDRRTLQRKLKRLGGPS